jgi:hypothetical protein
MKIKAALLAAAMVCAALATAQENKSAPNTPPKVLVITREFVKPGRAGATHEKAESAFVQAMSTAKWPVHYLAADSLTGKTRSLFLTAYDSFEGWEKDALAQQKNQTLSAALEKAAYSDGDLLTEMGSAVFMYREDLSLRPNTDMPHMRYFEIGRYQVKPGHGRDWERLVKKVIAGYDKIQDVHWACYEAGYGAPEGLFLVFTARKSATEIDHAFAQGKDFEAAMGEEGMKELDELFGSCVESSEQNLYAFNPRMSYVSDEWIKADAEFWAPKSAVATTHKKKGATEAAKE